MTLHVVFAAAGVGTRFGAEIPKQYVNVLGRSVMDWTLSAWDGLVDGESIVSVARDDPFYADVLQFFPSVKVAFGGVNRAQSVLNALLELRGYADNSDWVMVHDIARLCVRASDVLALAEHCQSTQQGGLLASKLTDTIKQTAPSGGQITTLNRDLLWAALTPQCFRLGELIDALESAKRDGISITDEASAMEKAGHITHLVEGHRDNIKLTHSADIVLVEHILRHQGRF